MFSLRHVPPRPVTQMLVGWLDENGMLRDDRGTRLLSEREALDLLTRDIEHFGEPSLRTGDRRSA